MTSTKKDPVLVVLQLSGGNDFMNTIVPYSNPLYFDNRPNVRIPADQVLPINDQLGFNPNMAPLKRLYDDGKVAIIQGVGYPNPNLSHFRSMDIWHTCEPDKLADEGWVGRAIRDLDPKKENVLTGVNFGRGLPRAMAAPGVPVASVGNLETYGVLTTIEVEQKRTQAWTSSPACTPQPSVAARCWSTSRRRVWTLWLGRTSWQPPLKNIPHR
jgi:uncharacterized protein (DUF1501 family)